ncbi:hypothetical protein EDB83DRAFT_2407402 [Lactarius deliciosus]|nr:hypothetical protein EDB83DRAFT_2407402 [Lactarius deliciosus]
MPYLKISSLLPHLSAQVTSAYQKRTLVFAAPHSPQNKFMAKIPFPLLRDPDIEITFNRPIFTVSKFGKSIDQIEMQKSRAYRRADILYSERAISISFTQPPAMDPTRLELRVSCEPLVLQLSSMSLICKVLSGSALLLGVEQLYLNAKRPSSVNEQDDSESKQWLEIIHHFRGTKWVHVAGEYSTRIGLALQLSNKWRETVLPSLQKLCIQEPEQHCVSLREAILSFMHARRLFGSFIGVEYERLPSNEARETGPSPQRVPIVSLDDDVLLDIFRLYLEASPKSWPTLVHVCQNWRRIVFASPRSLHLRLCCKHGTPVSKTLDCWPALPITMQYGGSSTLDPPAPEDEDNVMAALRQSDRVSSISLTITDSLLEKFVTIEEPFSGLEELDLLSPENVQLTLPNIFQWGPRLRSLRLTRIAIPALQRLSSSTNLVDLQLYEIPSTGYISPEAFANALSGMTKLRSLSFHLLSLPPHHNFLRLLPSSGQRIVLLSLTCLKYRGTSRYFNKLVSRIDAPRLGDVDITFVDHSTIDIEASQLGQFIDRIEMQRLPNQADVSFSQSAISIRFAQWRRHPGIPTRFVLRISCKRFPLQLSSMARILAQFPYFSFRVKDLGINATEPSGGRNVVGEQWLGLFHAFDGAEDFHVANELAKDILGALHTDDGGHSTVLPALRNLHIRGPLSMSGSLWDAVQSFNTSRWLSSHPVQVYAEKYMCHRCASCFQDQRDLKFHLKKRHGYQIVCSHCGEFEWSLEDSRPFREHIESNHPEVTQIGRISSSSQSFSDLSSGYIFEFSTTVKPGLRPNRGTDRQHEPTISTPPIPSSTPADA